MRCKDPSVGFGAPDLVHVLRLVGVIDVRILVVARWLVSGWMVSSVILVCDLREFLLELLVECKVGLRWRLIIRSLVGARKVFVP